MATLKLDPIEKAVADIAAGKPVVVVDDEDRENEGDLIMAAEKATPESVAFIVRHTSGILCAPLEGREAKRLNLSPMVAENDAPLATAFTVSVDFRHGLTTGISAEERCNTVRALANPNSGSGDFVRPGHIFPLVAKDGGVLIRTGHTEAAVDLARLAGCAPVGLICELVNDDGSVKKGGDLQSFAVEHDLALVSIDDLIAYRQKRERLVERIDDRMTDTAIGPVRAITYTTRYDQAEHVALVYGEVEGKDDVLVRLQVENVLRDAFGPADRPVMTALERIREEGGGVLVYLRHGAAGVSESRRAEAAENGEGAESDAARREHWRDVGLGAQILLDLGIRKIRVLASRERQYIGLSGFDIEITETAIYPEDA
ncbi:3,4-dihydroxy-2-butanone-4-phosphate synthase [Marivibrio halodurans]|uniref:3,4-dihydroxy-2-butanone 4-phosphate synthase n=1 Tax=Marivibrio halodurans TaxID=2039722 RepID=A0A8J7S9A1_9PROT|nr:3,4-dihydroxy-2-butanone-4-phosphate synthase [Marivibrio halodurans]MBP5857812.1 3,4-dihydroxy-2-butanone-4-phosphate synthase [Marivibrio halodurans]